MAISQTALSAAITATDLTLSVASGTGFPTAGAPSPANPAYLVRIDKEYMLAISQPTAGVIKIAQRGYNGTAAAAHDTLAKVEVSSAASDFAEPSSGNSVSLPPYIPQYQTIGQDKTFTSAEIAAYGNQPQNFALTKATAAAITLVAPSKAQDGLTLVFTNLTNAAHVITATSLLADAVSGSPHTTATFAAFIGSSLTLQAQNGLWNVIAAVVCPIT
jgi:hypothetical protein